MCETGMGNLVVQERVDRTVRLTLNNPPANTLSLEMLVTLNDELSRLEQEQDCGVIVIAADNHIFCAGHDLKELLARRRQTDRGRTFYRQLMDVCSQTMMRIVNHSKPVIAEVAGVATAAGCQLVASCDLAIASDEARFATPGVNVGLFCSSPAVALSRSVGRKAAMEMLLTGEMIDAATAKDFGLVNRVVPNQYLRTVVMKYADVISSKPPSILKLGKQAFYKQSDLDMESAYRYANDVMVENMMQIEVRDGISEFVSSKKAD